ncbi:hypothetical protein BH23GEM3_BH23GEM3_00250 [soil metagenome]
MGEDTAAEIFAEVVLYPLRDAVAVVADDVRLDRDTATCPSDHDAEGPASFQSAWERIE